MDRAGKHRLQRAVCPRGVGPRQADGSPEEPALLRRQGDRPREGRHSDHPVRGRCPALREQRDRPHDPAGRRPQAVP